MPTSVPTLILLPETTVEPTSAPTTEVPTYVPTTVMPTSVPTLIQLFETVEPTYVPTKISHSPSSNPTLYPSEKEKIIPTLEPTEIILSLISKISFNVTQVKILSYIIY